MKIVQYLLFFPARFRSDFCDNLLDKNWNETRKNVNFGCTKALIPFRNRKFSILAFDSKRSVCLAAICYIRSDIAGSDKWANSWGEKDVTKFQIDILTTQGLVRVYTDRRTVGRHYLIDSAFHGGHYMITIFLLCATNFVANLIHPVQGIKIN